jgi:hypothetical protein
LQVDGIVWTKFTDATDILLRDIEKPHSMELYPDSIEGYEDDNGIFYFTKFDFNGCCILGSDKEPAMIDSNVIVQFTMSDFVKNIQSELNDKYKAFMKCKENNRKGGNEPMSQTQNDFTITLNQKIEALAQIVNDYETFKDKWDYEWSRYCLVDVQEDEVIVIDRKDHYNHYGIPFTTEGDNYTVNFENAKRKKIVYEDLEEGSTTENIFDFEGEINSVGDNLFAKVTEVTTKLTEVNTQLEETNTKLHESNENYETMQNDYTKVKQDYDSLKQEYDDIKPKYDEYEKKEQEEIAEKLEADKNAQFERFENVLADNPDFLALKEKKDELSVQEIENECSVLYARTSLASFSKNTQKDNSLGIIDDTQGSEPNYVRTKYGDIPVNK